jgi:uncharacterized damage-inducible protein DinB
MSSHKDLIQAYLAGSTELQAAVAGMNSEQLKARAVPGKWSTLEVVAHLADFEPIYMDRMKRIIALDNPSILAADENLFAQRLAYQDRDCATELALITATRASMAAILSLVPDSAWHRVGVHSERGQVTLEMIVLSAANHIAHHVPFIQQKRKALGC